MRKSTAIDGNEIQPPRCQKDNTEPGSGGGPSGHQVKIIPRQHKVIFKDNNDQEKTHSTCL